MPDFTKRVRKGLELPVGEKVVQAAVAQPAGSISRGFAEQRTSLGAVASAVQDKLAGDDDGAAMSGRVPARNGYLVATDRRLLWAGQRRTGSVGDIEAEFAYGEIVSATLGDGGGMSNKLLTIAFLDGSAVEVAVAKGQKPALLAEAIQARLAPPP